MRTLPPDLATLLLHSQVVTPEQLAETRSFSERTGLRLEDALVKMGYANYAVVMMALAHLLKLEFIDLTDVILPPSVVELIPESVARENVILPFFNDRGTLLVITSDPFDVEMREKLRFILNREIELVLATRAQILCAIDRHYGESAEECCDELLSEFTDTAIDFTESEYSCLHEPVEVPAVELAPVSAPGHADRAAPALLERQATVRYYHRMNPERLYPLLVAITAAQVREAVQKGVRQARSEAFEVAADSVVAVEPILPGCQVYPPQAEVVVGAGDCSVKFHVVPHVLGPLEHARVVIRQQGRVLAEVPLEARVSKQALAVLMGVLSFIAPVVSMVFKHFKVNFQEQLGLFAQVGQWLLAWPPELLAVPFLAAAGALYLTFRPRQRAVFWDIQPVSPPALADEAPAAQARERSVPPASGAQATLLAAAETAYAAQRYEAALTLFQQGLALGTAKAENYHHAALAAAYRGDNRQALAILRSAEKRLGCRRIPGALWFNMACFATRLGEFADAIRYIHRAIEAGYCKIDKYLSDPDLLPLRARGEFRQVLAELERSA